MEVKAKVSNLRVSPRKARLVANLVKGMKATTAVDQLKFTNKKSAEPFAQLIKSAMANAEHNHDMDVDNLKINELKVDAGITLKRYMPRAFGRATMIRQRFSHLSVILGEIVPGLKSKAPKRKIKQDNGVQGGEGEEEKKEKIEKKFDEKSKINTTAHKRRLFNRKAG